jgi:hypothetical protein
MSGPFTRSPKVYATYTDPVKIKDKTTSTTGITKIKRSSPMDKFEFSWRKKVRLYSKRELSSARKNGETTAKWLTNNPIKDLQCNLYIKARSSDSSRIDSQFRVSALVSPRITSIKTEDGKDPSNGIPKNSVLIIKGTYFGSKLPKVKLEYKDSNGKIKFYKLKVLHIFKYDNAKGKPEKSCMNVDTGESQISVSLPKNIETGSYSLLLSNKIGIAVELTTKTLPVVKIE